MASRIENILQAMIDGTSSEDLPKAQSRNEELLKQVLDKMDGGGTMSQEVQTALLNLFRHAAYIDDQGASLIAALELAFKGNPARIGAVYNPPAGYVVYTDDDLDKVSAYLTVTLYYSDDSSATTTDYTLTGTLTEGTSTLTVEYDNLTTTVQVEVERGLPDEYTAHDYIYVNHSPTTSTSDNYGENPNARIKTDIYPDLNVLNYRIEGFDMGNNYANTPFIGVRLASGNAQCLSCASGIVPNHTGNIIAGIYHGVAARDVQGDLPTVQTNAWSVITLQHDAAQSQAILTVNDTETLAIPYANTNVLNAPLGFFTSYDEGTGEAYCYIGVRKRLRRVTITNQSGQVISDFVACVRNADQVIGFYDLIGRKFFTSVDPAYATIGNSKCVYGVSA